MADSWKLVAHKLGARMRYHNYCSDHKSFTDGVKQGCPFCADIAAYAAYTQKLKLTAGSAHPNQSRTMDV